ncbi:hypothetical protein K449DRAFT_324713, partial [Hypoxylon sp. EC38]
MDPSQGQLIPASDGFAQQGSLDWVSLSKSSVSFTVDVLGRYMAAGVSPFTIVVGQAIARNLPLSTSGRKDVQSALNGLKCYQGIGQAIWFGFGVKSFVRTLASTAEGMSLVAFLAAASEILGDDAAAEMIYELSIEFKSPESLTPSVHEWSMVVRACSGVLSATKFPVHFEGLQRLQPIHYSHERSYWPEPKGLARAVMAVSCVLTGEYLSITIEGHLGAYWIAAVAEWLYGLSVNIIGSNGDLVYSTNAGISDAQINIRLRKMDAGPSLDLTTCIYRITDQVLFIRDNPFHASGRLGWSRCLRDCFGAPMDELLKDTETVGTLFGCFSNFLQGVMNRDPSLPPFNIYGTFEEAGGHPFILESIRKLPELEPLRNPALQSLKLNVTAASTTLLRGLLSLALSCGCKQCDSYPNRVSYAEDRNCRFFLFATLLFLCQTLAGVDFDLEIGPRRNGLFAIYHH